MTWHLLQISDVLDIEFGSALTGIVPLRAWEPVRSFFPWLEGASERVVDDPPLRISPFPLLRGYARFPLSVIARTGPAIAARLARCSDDPASSPLICTIPYFAPVAERWPGPVIYWLTDFMAAYKGANASQVHELDRRMCRAATLVCPNSQRIADYLTGLADCDPAKVHVLPNATRAANLLAEASLTPAGLPEDVRDMKRPVAGVIGNLAGNLDWNFLENLVRQTPDFSWLFVGPTTMAIPDPGQNRAREAVTRHPNARFIGRRPYGKLAGYARALDVAVMPYRRSEPTYSGSATRYFEHLAACRPMIATRGLAQLYEHEPLLRLVDGADEAALVLADLRSKGFDDGLAAARWKASHSATWQVRARSMHDALGRRWPNG